MDETPSALYLEHGDQHYEQYQGDGSGGHTPQVIGGKGPYGTASGAKHCGRPGGECKADDSEDGSKAQDCGEGYVEVAVGFPGPILAYGHGAGVLDCGRYEVAEDTKEGEYGGRYSVRRHGVVAKEFTNVHTVYEAA